ncbi:hypothetical protein FACS1894122_01620 [Alphaproteobacteria bacterium]|nr:hypothetical protein FACS1894122_01620 [Alphaproteobacteria bacterium]
MINRKKGIYFMAFLNNNFVKYIVYLASLVVCCACDQNDKISPPFSDNAGYIKNEISFAETIYDEKGQPFTLANFKGNVVIVAFSATWCHNCPDVLQSLDSLKAKNIPGLKIVALNVGNEGINEIKIHYKSHDIQLLDVYQSVRPTVMKEIRGVPACLIFDTNGKFVCGYLGRGIDFCSTEFVSFIKSLAEQTKTLGKSDDAAK